MTCATILTVRFSAFSLALLKLTGIGQILYVDLDISLGSKRWGGYLYVVMMPLYHI